MDEPLSEVHAMLGELRRDTDASRLNIVVNDPSVYPWVRGGMEGPLDLTPIIADPSHVLLMGEHGGELFLKRQPGLFEAHTQVIPSGRGAWALTMVRAALHYLFTSTDAVEAMTHVPKGNLGARALARAIGGRFQFTNPRGWVKDGKVIPTDIFALTIQDWMKDAPGLAERGHWFHQHLEVEYRRLGRSDPLPHPEDQTHDRYVGAAAEMFLGGQPDKAVIFYNRWAAFAGYAPISIIARHPLTIDIQDALVIVRPSGEFHVATLVAAAA